MTLQDPELFKEVLCCDVASITEILQDLSQEK